MKAGVTDKEFEAELHKCRLDPPLLDKDGGLTEEGAKIIRSLQQSVRETDQEA